MKARNLWYACAAASAFMLPGLAIGGGTCSHSTKIRNDSNVTMRIVELKSSSSEPIFKSQWKGNLAIAPGETKTIGWTSDFSCEVWDGTLQRFDIKLIRKIGETHYCDELVQSQAVRLEAPDLCFRN